MKPTRVKLSLIELDTSIQCRAQIDTGIVNEYADRISEGDEFPPVDLFVTHGKYWIGDGWHRILAAKNVGADDVWSNVKPGGRVDALKSALGANSAHGHRRTNADKRRAVEIALREFPKLSARAVAEMCGVSHPFVSSVGGEALESVSNATRTTKDGRQYPAKRQATPAPVEPQEDATPEESQPKRTLGPPCIGMQFARMAIYQLEQIKQNDTERIDALNLVKGWIEEHEG